MSFLEYPVGLNQNTSNPLVGDAGYKDPLRPFIRFMDKDSQDTNYLIDAFRSSNPLQCTGLDCSNGIGETGGATIHILHDSNVDESLINWGNKVQIKLAKTQGEFTNNPDSTFLIGYVTGYTKNRPATNILEHVIQIQGSKKLFNDRKINYKKSTSSSTSSKFQIKSHIEEIISKRASYPFASPDLEEQGNFDLSGISEELTTFLGKVNFELTEAGSAIQSLADIEGARFFIDYKGDSEIVTIDFPSHFHTGVQVKSGDLKSNLDSALYTSYFAGEWSGNGDITGSTGFANRLMTKTQIERKEFTSSFTNKSSTNLTFKAIAQKFFISETRISDIGLILSMQGEVTSQKDRVNGRIIADNNNSPTGNIISNFNIPLSSIEKEPETIFINDLDVKQRFVGQAAPAWIVLYQRSGTEEVNKSEPNHDEQNTIRWHNNKDTGTVTTLPSMIASSGDREDNLNWKFSNTSTTGPTYCFGVFAEIRHIQEVSDRGSIQRYGLVDGEVDTSFLDDPNMIQRYLGALLQYSAKPRLSFTTNSLEIPNRFLFKPYQWITLIDSLAYPRGIDVEIQSVHYSFAPENYALGCKRADVTPIGYYDYKDESYKCL